jgi:CHAT domain-containing protein
MRQKGVFWIIGLGVATGLVILCGAILICETSVSEMTALVAAADDFEYRPMEARLHGGFAYRPIQPVLRSMRAPIDAPLAVIEAAAKIQEKTKHNRAVETLHALGNAHTLLGRPRIATGVLIEALRKETGERDLFLSIRKSKNAVLLTDLAAAYLTEGIASDNRMVLAQAADVALRAASVEQSPEAVWNVALALDSLHIVNQAKRGWQNYLHLDSVSPWADEVRRRLSLADRHVASVSVPERWAQLRYALRSLDQTAIDAFVTQFPMEARTYGEDVLLSDWANASSVDEQLRFLDEATSIAAALRGLSGETLLQDEVKTIKSAVKERTPTRLRQLVNAHKAYGEGRAYYSKQDMSMARDRFRDAEIQFDAARSPFLAMARLYLAGSYYYLGKQIAAREELERSWRVLKHSNAHRAATALTAWILGLVRLGDGYPHESLDLYRVAAAQFELLREIDNQAAVANLIAENLEHLARPEEAAAARHRAFTLYRFARTRSKMGQVLNGAARDAYLADQEALARVYLNEAIELATSRSDQVTLVESLRWLLKGIVTTDADAERRLQSQLDATLTSVADPELRASLRADFDALAATGRTSHDLIKALDAAIAVSSARGAMFYLPELYLRRGRAYRSVGAFTAARNDFEAAIRTSLHISQDVRSPFYMRILRTGMAVVLDELVDVCVYDAQCNALAAAESGRDLDKDDATWDMTAKAKALLSASQAMPENVVVLSYYVLPTHILLWTTRRSGTNMVEIRGSDRMSLATAVDAYLTTIESGSEEWRGASKGLYARLVAPAGLKKSDMIVVIVGHRSVGVVPFASLCDAAQKPMIARHQLVYAKSVVGGIRSTNIQAPLRHALLVAAPDIRNYRPHAPVLTEAMREIVKLATVHGSAAVLSGANATRAAVVRALPLYDLIHFAAHAEVNDGVPIASCINLAWDGRSPGTSSLYAAEVEQLQLAPGAVVVLASCRSARPASGAAEDWFSLGGAFLRAGAQFTVASQSDVDDQEVLPLVVWLHSELAAGASAPAALRSAQLHMLESQDRYQRRPRAWANIKVMTH